MDFISAQGISRSASVVIGYLMKTQCLNFEESYRFVKEKRKCVCPLPGKQNGVDCSDVHSFKSFKLN